MSGLSSNAMSSQSLNQSNTTSHFLKNENAMRAVDHCGYMLSGTDMNVMVFTRKGIGGVLYPKKLSKSSLNLKKFWQRKAGEAVAPYLKKSKERLLNAGLSERRNVIKAIDGSRNTARDILDKASSNHIGTIILGKRGDYDVKDFSSGSIARKVWDEASDMAICMVS